MKILNHNISNKAMAALAFTIAVLLLLLFHFSRTAKRRQISPIIDGVEYIDSNNTYHKLYTDKEFNDLKAENKSLYDSLKSSKKYIDYLLQFNYKKTYSSGKVETSNGRVPNLEQSKDFTYEDSSNSSFSYKLLINSEKEPNYYKLDVNVNDKITVVDKGSDGANHLTISPSDGAEISNATVFKRNSDSRKRFLDRFAIGPSVTVGYDPLNKRIGTVVGVSVTYNLR